MTKNGWSFAQWALFLICVYHVVQAAIGFVLEPSFEVGPDAPTARLLGMDYNGWHAGAGLALFAPGLIFAQRKSWAVLYLLLGAFGGAAPGVWALFSQRVAYIFAFPNNVSDAVVHLTTAAVMVGVAIVQIVRDGGLHATLSDLRGGLRRDASRRRARYPLR